MIDIRADLFSATGKNADSFHVDFVETDSIALDWKPVGNTTGCQKKTIMLHLRAILLKGTRSKYLMRTKTATRKKR